MVNEAIIGGLMLWLYLSGGPKKDGTAESPKPASQGPPKSASAVPWPVIRATEAAASAAEAAAESAARGSHAGIPGADAETGPLEAPPEMQKGMPAVTEAAEKGLEQLRREAKAREVAKQTGKSAAGGAAAAAAASAAGAKWRPKMRPTSAEVARANAILHSNQWKSGCRIDEGNVQYRCAMHGPKKGVEIWEYR